MQRRRVSVNHLAAFILRIAAESAMAVAWAEPSYDERTDALYAFVNRCRGAADEYDLA